MKKFIKELFDSDNLRSKFEIPYLTDKEEFAKSFSKKIKMENDIPGGEFFWKLSFEFPELEELDQHVIEDTVLAFSTISKTPHSDGRSYYCQIGLWISKERYFNINIIIKDVVEINHKMWFIKDYSFMKVEESYEVVKWFLETAKKVNCNISDYKYLKN